jgi:hypothetical protein
VVGLTCFVMCVGDCMCGSFDNCVDVLVVCELVFTVFCTACTLYFVLFRLCTFTLTCYVCTSVRTTAIE